MTRNSRKVYDWGTREQTRDPPGDAVGPRDPFKAGADQGRELSKELEQAEPGGNLPASQVWEHSQIQSLFS